MPAFEERVAEVDQFQFKTGMGRAARFNVSLPSYMREKHRESKVLRMRVGFRVRFLIATCINHSVSYHLSNTGLSKMFTTLLLKDQAM